MNGPNTPAFVKDNAFTRLIDRVSEINAMEGKPAGRSASQAAEHFVSAIPANRVRSLRPDQAARLDYVPPPLAPEEIIAANNQAQALGLGDQNDDVPDGGGGPSEAEIEEMLRIRRPFRAAPAPSGGGTPQAVPVDLPTGTPVSYSIATARSMPDFRKVQGFNLERGVAVVDGMEFPVPTDDLTRLKKYALSVVLDTMVVQVAKALVEFGLPQEMADAAAQKLRETAASNAAVLGSEKENGGTEEAVLEVPEGTADQSVPPEPSAEGRKGEVLQGMHERSQEEGDCEADTEWLLEDR